MGGLDRAIAMSRSPKYHVVCVRLEWMCFNWYVYITVLLQDTDRNTNGGSTSTVIDKLICNLCETWICKSHPLSDIGYDINPRICIIAVSGIDSVMIN